MARKGILFKDWCNKNGYNLGKAYVGDRKIEQLDSLFSSNQKSKLTFRCENCGNIYTSTPQTIKDNKKHDNGKFICDVCHRNIKKINKSKVNRTNLSYITVQEWLNANTNIIFIGEITNSGINANISPSSIPTNSNKRIRVMCTTHNYIKEGRVQNICNAKMNCCKPKLLFQDWCLIFYRYRFYAYYKSNMERRTKVYTGKQAFNYYRDNSQSSDRKELQTLLTNDSISKYFKCSKDNGFEAPIDEVCNGKTWCDKNCIECNKKAYAYNKESSEMERLIDDFFDAYCNGNSLIKHKYEAKKKLYSEICSQVATSNAYTLERIIDRIIENDKAIHTKILEVLNTTKKRREKNDLRTYKSVEETRKRIISFVEQIISSEENSNPEIENMRTWYDNYRAIANYTNDNCFCLIIPEREINGREVGDKNGYKNYDYLIYLNDTTINGLKEDILYGRPIKHGHKEIEMIPKTNLSEKDIGIKEIKQKWLSPVFNGVAQESFKNQSFKDFEFLDDWVGLENGAFENCRVNGELTIPQDLFANLRSQNIITVNKDTNNKNNITLVKFKYTSITKRIKSKDFGINNIKSVGIGFMQYEDIFKIGEALRVYDNRLTLYRRNKNGVFQEYEYINGFNCKKFYNSEDEMIIFLLLSQYNIVKVSEVTEALIDIYNEMSS